MLYPKLYPASYTIELVVSYPELYFLYVTRDLLALNVSCFPYRERKLVSGNILVSYTERVILYSEPYPTSSTERVI